MKKLNYFIVAMTLLFANPLTGQDVQSFALDIGGGAAQNEQFAVLYSVGQLSVQTLTLEGMTVNEGFIQGEVEEVSTAVVLHPQLKVGVFPNPSMDFINISTSEMIAKSSVSIFNIHGQKMIERSFEQNMRIDLMPFPAGSYFLQWINQDGLPIRKYRIIKL